MDRHAEQESSAAAVEAHHLIAAVEAIYRQPSPAPVEIPTSFRDTSPVPAIGTAPPVAQPGRPPMSQRATDISGVMLAGGLASVPVLGGVSLLLWTAGHVDPAVIGIVCLSPVALLATLSQLCRRAKETVAAAPPVITKHYNGTVHQHHTSYSSATHGLIARTHNDNRH